MSDWAEIEFGDLFDTIYRYPTYYGIEYADKGVKEVRGELLSLTGRIDDACRYISYSTATHFPKVQLKEDDIVISVRGTLGKIGFVDSQYAGAVITANLLRLSPNRNIVEAKWLLQLMIGEHFKTQLELASSQTTIKTIQVPQLTRIRISLPPRRDQKKIAKVLSTIDRIIEKTEALIHKYQQIKTGLMHDLFTRGVTADGKLRPPRKQAPELYKETPIGWIPKDWGVKRLHDILKNSGGYLQTGPFGSQLHSHEYTHEGVPVVMPQNINDGKIDDSDIARIPEKRAQILNKHRMKVCDIVIARRGDLSRSAAIYENEKGWVCGTGCFLLRLISDNLDSRFFSYIYQHDIIQRQIEGLAVGTTMQSLNNSVMNALYFPFIEKKEQDHISSRLESVECQINSLIKQQNKLKKQKSGLMHDLLTGKVQVSVN